MSRVIDGIRYYTATEVARELGVSRQTIWRWRREARIPPGNRFRDGQVMFAESELQAVRERYPADGTQEHESVEVPGRHGRVGQGLPEQAPPIGVKRLEQENVELRSRPER